MTLSERIIQKRQEGRRAGVRAGIVMDLQLMESTSREQVDGFVEHDATSDHQFRGAIKKLYRALTSDEQRELCALVYATWDSAERQDDGLLDEHGDHIDHTRAYIYKNAPTLVEADGCGPDGRAA